MRLYLWKFWIENIESGISNTIFNNIEEGYGWIIE